MLYEIRDYHYRTDKFDEYKVWADKAVPVLRDLLDVAGFWIDSGEKPEINGSNPQQSAIGHANVTWILRWRDRAHRDAVMGTAFTSDAWKAVWAEHPDPDGYVQMLSRFMDEM